MSDKESGPVFSKKVFNPDELLAALKAQTDLTLAEFQKKLKMGLQDEFERRVGKLKANLEGASRKAVEQYNKGIEDLDQYKDMPILFEQASNFTRRQLEMTLKFHDTLLQQFITNCQDLIN